MKRFALLAVCGLMLAAGSGCCWHNYPWGAGYGACGGGCPNGACGYGAGYGGYPGATYPSGYYGGTAMTAGVPVYTAGAPVLAPTAALNPVPTY